MAHRDEMNDKPVTVSVEFKNGTKGEYECKKRPYFAYENNTAMLHLNNGTTIVINMREVVLMMY